MRLAKAVERAAENEQLQQSQDSPGARHSAQEVKRQNAPFIGAKGSAVEQKGGADLLQRVIEAPPVKAWALRILCIRIRWFKDSTEASVTP